VAKRDRVIAQHEAKLAEQHAEIQLLLARRFGPSSEQVNTAQLGLFNEAELEADAAGNEDCHDARQVKGPHAFAISVNRCPHICRAWRSYMTWPRWTKCVRTTAPR
jgi:hypothetical protein